MGGRRLQLPQKIGDALERLSLESKYRLQIARRKQGYYVYQIYSKYNPALQKIKKYQLYYGKIEESGEFVAAHHRSERTNVGSVRELAEGAVRIDPLRRLKHPDETDRRILTILGTDGRASIAYIAKELGMAHNAAEYRVRRLERTYGIRYTVEVASRPFGYFRSAVLVKFISKRPDPQEIKEELEKEPTIQYAAMLTGAYDLFFYIFSKNTGELENTLYKIRSSRVFVSCTASWKVSYMAYSYGYAPARDGFIELQKSLVWRRTKERPKKQPGEITEREYSVLKALNENARQDFTVMDKRLGLGNGSSFYTYGELVKKGIIRRATITMTNLPMMYLALLECEQLDISRFNANRDKYMINIIEERDTPTNRYALVGDIGSPYGVLFIAPIYEESDLNDMEGKLSLLDMEVKESIITRTLVGELGFRKIEQTVTAQYQILKELTKNKNITVPTESEE